MSSLAITINHDDVGMRSFPVKSDDNATIDLGGFTSERAINGDGTGRKVRTRKGWEIANINLAVSIPDEDVEFLQEVQNSPKDAQIIYEHSDGFTYQGIGSIEGDIKPTTNDGYAGLTLTGSGELKKLA